MTVTFTKGGGGTPSGEGAWDAAGSLALVEGGENTFQINDLGRGDFEGAGNLPVTIVRKGITGLTAFAGGGQGSAVALTGRFNNVTTCATAGDSVALKAAALGEIQTVKNSGATALDVFPVSADSINALAADLAVRIPPGGAMTFYAISATVWETLETYISFAPTTVLGGLELKGVDNAGNFIVTLSNASHGQASVHSFPDPGGATGTVMELEPAQTVAGINTYSAVNIHNGADVHNAADLFASGAAAAAVAMRFGASATEGWEIRAIDETVTCDAVSKDLTEDIPDGAVILSVQGNKETAGAAGGTTTNWGIGTVGNPDLYSPTVGVLTLDGKIDHIPDYAVNSGAVDVQVHGVTAAGAIGDTAPGGTARVRIVYAALNSLDNA